MRSARTTVPLLLSLALSLALGSVAHADGRATERRLTTVRNAPSSIAALRRATRIPELGAKVRAAGTLTLAEATTEANSATTRHRLYLQDTGGRHPEARLATETTTRFIAPRVVGPPLPSRFPGVTIPNVVFETGTTNSSTDQRLPRWTVDGYVASRLAGALEPVLPKAGLSVEQAVRAQLAK
jgi:hypothetical protein